MENQVKSLNTFQFRGKRGRRNLLIIGLFEVNYDDFLSRIALQNMDAIARKEGYDGWIRTSLCPFKDSRKLNSTDVLYDTYIHYKLSMLSYLLAEKDMHIADVWLMWGDGVENKHRLYLKKAIGFLYGILLKYDLRYWCIRRTRLANPKDCSPESLKGIMPEVESPGFIKFDFQHYVHSRSLALEPEIVIK